jgi:antitoxin (DNA-binding transcriptional repressor) of toxin-antitoxin stability system
LPELIAFVERGELITITRDKIPVADLAPSKAESKAEKSGPDPKV